MYQLILFLFKLICIILNSINIKYIVILIIDIHGKITSYDPWIIIIPSPIRDMHVTFRSKEN